MNKSLIFTDAEIKAIEKRKQGDKTDKTGIFFGRTKPKIEEILNYWISEKKTMQKLIPPASRRTTRRRQRHSSQN